MNSVFYFSGSGHSRAVADLFSARLNTSAYDICKYRKSRPDLPAAETAVIVFPVYSENIPSPVKLFLKELSAQKAVLIATYGRVSHGNVLWEAKKLVKSVIIAAAYVPAGHTFLDEKNEANKKISFDVCALEDIFKRISERSPISAVITREKKHPLASVFPNLRSRLGVKISLSGNCLRCNLCGEVCPVGAIKQGKTNSKCIRCLKCVKTCPKSALSYRPRKVLLHYLKSHRVDRLKIYL